MEMENFSLRFSHFFVPIFFPTVEYLRRLLLQSFALEMAAEREFRMLFEEHPSSTELVSFYGKFIKYMQNDESTEKRMITRAESLFELEVLEKDWKKNTSKEKIGTSEALHEVQQVCSTIFNFLSYRGVYFSLLHMALFCWSQRDHAPFFSLTIQPSYSTSSEYAALIS